MAAISSFYPWVMPSVPGAPDPLIDQALVSAAFEFCCETNVVQQTQISNGVAGTNTYAITPAAGMRLNTILLVAWEDRTLKPVAANDVQNPTALRGDIGSAVTPTGAPTHYYQKTPLESNVYLWPVPDTSLANGLYIKSALTTLPAPTTLPDDLYNTYPDTIAYGALAVLLALPAQPWTDANAAAAARARFEAGMSRASRDGRTGLVLSAQRVRQRRF